MAIRVPRRREAQNEVLGTYSFPSRTVRGLRTDDDRILWTCDCDKCRRQCGQREPLWCKHIAKAAARRSLDRLTRRVAVSRGNDLDAEG
jgi:Zn-dependent alcohol dehydrogenase